MTTPVFSVPQSTPVPEYQWWDELANDLSARPPGSNFVGKFSIVADPAMNNPTCALTYANQLHAHGVPFSKAQSPSVRNLNRNACRLIYPCSCQQACGAHWCGQDTSLTAKLRSSYYAAPRKRTRTTSDPCVILGAFSSRCAHLYSVKTLLFLRVLCDLSPRPYLSIRWYVLI
ncbi:hypothetical protein BC827DRAFT_650783 [Russula dissimulans]|nr:hypothetical protein BC827DRAFT_650783 [Russula dissimulans]